MFSAWQMCLSCFTETTQNSKQLLECQQKHCALQPPPIGPTHTEHQLLPSCTALQQAGSSKGARISGR